MTIRDSEIISSLSSLFSGIVEDIPFRNEVPQTTEISQTVINGPNCEPYIKIDPPLQEVSLLPPEGPITKVTDIYRTTNKQRYVIESIVGELDKFEGRNKDPNLLSNDQVRSVTGHFWFPIKESLIKPLIYKVRQLPSNVRDVTSLLYENSPDKTLEIKFESLNYFSNQSNGGSDRLRIEELFSIQNGKVVDLDSKKRNFDFLFDVDIPYNKKDLEFLQKSNREPLNSLRVFVENDYNFYVSFYEKLLKNFSLSTNVLPNFYILLTNNFKEERIVLSDEQSLQYETNYSHDNILTISGALNLDSSSDEYHDIFARQIVNATQDQINYVNVKMSSIVFNSKESKIYKEFEYKKEQFPFYIKVSFDTESPGQIKSSLNELCMNDLFLSYIASKEADSLELGDKKSFAVASLDNNLETERNVPKLFLNLKNSLFDIVKENYKFNTQSVTYLGLLEKEILGLNEQQDRNNLAINSYFMDQFIEEFKRSNSRTYRDIIEGKQSYSETLFYRIDKYEISEQGQQSKIQSFYISNQENVGQLDIIDTQVKYEKRYIYKIYSYKAVLGNLYSYSQDSEKHIKSLNTPDIRIIDTFYKDVTAIVTDKPPPPPEVDIVPYKDNDSELLFLFNPPAIEYMLKPISFSDQEAYQLDLVRESQQLGIDEKIKFGGDDKIERYIIYRIESHPYGYEDFYNSTHQIVETLCNCTTAEFKDKLEPNKEYFYIFRSVDVHDYTSNPSDVWKVQLISEKGLTFLKKEVVNFVKKDFKKNHKNMRRFLHIKPNSLQSILNTSELGDNLLEEDIRASLLGNKEKISKSVWGKTFKLRLKSKQTNKYIDIKFSFNEDGNINLVEKNEESCVE